MHVASLGLFPVPQSVPGHFCHDRKGNMSELRLPTPALTQPRPPLPGVFAPALSPWSSFPDTALLLDRSIRDATIMGLRLLVCASNLTLHFALGRKMTTILNTPLLLVRSRQCLPKTQIPNIPLRALKSLVIFPLPQPFLIPPACRAFSGELLQCSHCPDHLLGFHRDYFRLVFFLKRFPLSSTPDIVTCV